MAGLGFWKIAQADPDWTAVIEEAGDEHRAGDVLARANQTVHALRALGMADGDGLTLLMPNLVEMVEIYAAALQAAWYYTPINFHLAGPEIAYIIHDAEAKAFFCHARFADLGLAAVAELEKEGRGLPKEALISVGGDIPGFTPLEQFRAGHSTDLPENRGYGTAMHYTSGTTGKPKGVRRALSGQDPDMMAEMSTVLPGFFGIKPGGGGVHLVTSPNYHTAVTQFGGTALQMGHTLALMDKWTPEGTLEMIQRTKATHTHMVPTQFHRMLHLPEEVKQRYDVSSMKVAIHAAAPCPQHVKRAMLDWWGPVIYEYYAATEGGGTIATPEDWVAHPGTVGKAWPISEVVALDDDGAEVAVGTPGTVYMKMGVGEFEYKGDKAKTEANRHNGYFTVGDIGYFDDDGFLYLCDRKIDMIISGGVNIYPAEIEGELLRHPAVGDVAVFGIPDEDWGEQIKAVVELNEGYEPADALAAEIIGSLEGRLARLKWPKTLDFTDQLPREPNGKLFKRRLRDPYWAGHQSAI
ncbi:acyl-CoA synthetase [Catenulispora pinisilvae]|uniref:acyl-CoA synthetase n=1 Tax=Catenulispora pinisilvae TaxID=2705253 RepID=UPI001891E04E|nr:acyl-CoA synthetase [Catenulispora pinisilvae]